jgi:hypothetical protein
VNNNRRDVALVTIALGQTYLERWQRYSEPGWRQYAARHGYDVVCIDKPLDPSARAQRRSPSWQKCLVASLPSLSHYRQLVWIDSDIIINWRKAPAVAQDIEPTKVGGVEVFSWPSASIYKDILAREYDIWGDAAIQIHTPQEYYTVYGLPGTFDRVMQGGVFVFSPAHHRPILEKVYEQYEERGGQGWHYEMRPLSYELMSAGVLEWIDSRFNQLWFESKVYSYPFLINTKSAPPSLLLRAWRKLRREIGMPAEDAPAKVARACATAAFMSSYFLHFAGAPDDVSWVDQSAESWRDCRLLW